MLSMLMAAAMAAGQVAPPAWHDQLAWQGRSAHMQIRADGSYVLKTSSGRRTIAPPRFRAKTASVLFDGLFAMAQSDLKRVSVRAITDGAFDHGKPIPCRCYIAGKKWPFVWTRDLSYSIDLGLWRFDPARARTSLLFKLSPTRGKDVPPGQYVMQDTGSGGSWPISTDRVVWFLGARHLLDDSKFADTVFTALTDTLRQDRTYAFDPDTGLYRGETSFLDWREQSYPAWTADNVVFIAQSYALSTNALHYEALRLAHEMAAKRHHDQAAARYAAQAAALKQAVNAHFWNARRGLYMSYIGGRVHPAPFDAYDLLGTDLAITSGIADPARARQALAHYPTWPAGSPVIWPERREQPIYHNRAIWPFVSEYTLRAARRIDDPVRIAHELRTQMRGAALYASNIENYSLRTQSTHVDEGKLSGPVVDSPRQLWSVAGYLDMVMRGVFGLQDDGSVKPKLPASLVPMLFGQRNVIALDLGDRRIVLHRPAKIDGNLLVAGTTNQEGRTTDVQLIARTVKAPALRMDAPFYLPATPPAPTVTAQGRDWTVTAAKPGVLYVNGRRQGRIDRRAEVARADGLQCFSVTARGPHGMASLHSPETCMGETPGRDRRLAAPLERAARRHLPGLAALRQRPRPDQHRHHRGGQAPAHRLRPQRGAGGPGGDAAERRRAGFDPDPLPRRGRPDLPLHARAGLQHEQPGALRALHRRPGRRHRTAQPCRRARPAHRTATVAPGELTMNRKPELSFWQIWNMCFGFLGIQFGFALQNANVSRIFQTLGAKVDDIADPVGRRAADRPDRAADHRPLFGPHLDPPGSAPAVLPGRRDSGHHGAGVHAQRAHAVDGRRRAVDDGLPRSTYRWSRSAPSSATSCRRSSARWAMPCRACSSAFGAVIASALPWVFSTSWAWPIRPRPDRFRPACAIAFYVGARGAAGRDPVDGR